MDPMSSLRPDPAVPPSADVPDEERSERLLRRWLREREARHEAERIAEAGLRRLYEANADLDRRVVERTSELESARLVAESADRTKTEFLANLGHDVRTPLHTILATLELASPFDEADRRRIEDATAATRSLRDMFTNLLELAQLEVGAAQFSVRPTNLAELVDDIVDRWRARLASHSLLLVPECPDGAAAQVVTDSDRLVQIINALLDNAAKFATAGTIRLTVSASPGLITVHVADDGPGVERDLLEKIFEPFARAASGSGRSAGSGVGLTLVRMIAELLGGHAMAQPSQSGGLAVVVTVPNESNSDSPANEGEQ